MLVYKVINAQSNEDMLTVSYYLCNFKRLAYIADIGNQFALNLLT